MQVFTLEQPKQLFIVHLLQFPYTKKNPSVQTMHSYSEVQVKQFEAHFSH